MPIELSEDERAFVRRLVESGAYRDEDAVLRAALADKMASEQVI